MELTDRHVAHIVNSVAARRGIAGLTSAHRPANRDNTLVIQVRGQRYYEFVMESDATAEAIRERAEETFNAAVQ